MNGKLWADMFFESLDSLSGKEKAYTDEAWTKFLGKVIRDVGEKTDCYAAMRREEVGDDEYSGEYFNIDALFIDKKEYENENNNGELLVLVGDDSLPEETEWIDYYSICKMGRQ
jgi:hypothetical protein